VFSVGRKLATTEESNFVLDRNDSVAESDEQSWHDFLSALVIGFIT
jgi:hypothetical protein